MTTKADAESKLLAQTEAWLDELDPTITPAHDPKELRQIGLAQRDLRLASQELNVAVDQARQAGYSWAAIGRTLGVTRQAAQSRFAQRVTA